MSQSRPTRRRAGFALGCGGSVVTSIFIAWVAILALIPVPACSCATPADLVVLNYSHQDARMSWNQPGLFGTFLRGLSGGESAPACKMAVAGLRSGLVHVSITAAGATREFDVHVRDALGEAAPIIVIRPDGQIDDSTASPPAGWNAYQWTLC